VRVWFCYWKIWDKNHLNSIKHCEKIRILQENSDKILGNDRIHCEICNLELNIMSYEKHVKGENHILKVPYPRGGA
jgi:hypothetical protein